MPLRHIENPCDRCHGQGSIAYGSTATWRGGMGGAMVTEDVCDKCWGSGDADRHWTDLRALQRSFDERVYVEAQRLLTLDALTPMRTLKPALLALLAVVEKESRRRKLPEGVDPYAWHAVTGWLARQLKGLVK